MTSFPSPSGTFGSSFEPPVSTRVSIMAIASLVLAILCFIPGAGLLAMLCGGAAILFISMAKGRLSGLGIAVAGCVIGLVATVLQGFLLLGAVSANAGVAMMLQPASTALTAMEKGDAAAARAVFTPTLDAAVTDERMAEFAVEYQSSLGKFKSSPDSFVSMISSYVKVGPMMQNVGNRQNVIPMPAEFDKGWAVVLIEIPQNPQGPTGGAGFQIPIENLGLLIDSGEIWLVPPSAGAAGNVFRVPPQTGAGTSTEPPSEPGSDAEPDPEAEPDPDAEPAGTP